MKEFEKAKQYYYHGEFQKAIDLITYLLNRKDAYYNSLHYSIILYYLGESRLALYGITKKKILVYEAIEDFATGENSLLINHRIVSTDLKNQIKKCIELI